MSWGFLATGFAEGFGACCCALSLTGGPTALGPFLAIEAKLFCS